MTRRCCLRCALYGKFELESGQEGGGAGSCEKADQHSNNDLTTRRKLGPFTKVSITKDKRIYHFLI